MSISQRIKKQALADGGVVLGIVVVGALYLWISSNNLPGWDIRKKNVTVDAEEKTVQSNVYVRQGATLKLRDSTLLIDSLYDSGYGVFVTGDSRLELQDSSITGGDYSYSISTTVVDGKSPAISILDSSLEKCDGVFLSGRSAFSARNSEIGMVIIQDNVRADIMTSVVNITFVSDTAEQFTDIHGGDKITKDIVSESGWRLKLTDAQVLGYRFMLDEGDELDITESTDIAFSFVSPGDLQNAVTNDLSFVGSPSDGTVDNLGFDLVWSDTEVADVSLYGNGTDELQFTHGIIRTAEVRDTSVVSLTDAQLECHTCMVTDEGTLTLSSVSIQPYRDKEPVLLVRGLGHVIIEDSDIRTLKIVMIDKGTVVLRNSQYEESLIENVGDGSFDAE